LLQNPVHDVSSLELKTGLRRTCAGGVAVGGNVVPGGITLRATVVEFTAVQLAVNEMGAVFSRTCTSTVQVTPGLLQGCLGPFAM
jgi:hypothetical protein